VARVIIIFILINLDLKKRPVRDIRLFMKKLFWILAPLILIVGTIIFAIAVTDNSPENPFKKYSIVILVGLFCISGFIKIIYTRLYK